MTKNYAAMDSHLGASPSPFKEMARIFYNPQRKKPLKPALHDKNVVDLALREQIMQGLKK